MAEEQLVLNDGMSASLRRIAQEAEKLNRRMVSLKSRIKDLEKPTSLSYMRKELRETEKQAQATERAIVAMKRAEAINSRTGAFTVGRNGSYYVNGMRVSNSQAGYMASAYSRNYYNGVARRDALLWANGRRVNGLTFDDRLARMTATNPRFAFSRLRNELRGAFSSWGSSISTQSLSDKFLRLAATVGLVTAYFNTMGNIIKTQLIQPQEEYVSNYTRVALTNDRKKTPREVMDELYDTASRTRAPADATMMLYNRIALSGVKADNERIRRFTETFNKVTAISGTTAQENRAVMLQLAQGIGSNRLGGDEFRSISEQAPLFKYMLAKGMGVNPGALKQMGADGKLTAEAILSAMEKVQDEVDLIFKEAPLTIGQSITILQNKWQQMINNQFTGYLAVRDLVKDIISWMDTPRGQQIITEIINSWNKALFVTVSIIRRIAPYILWAIRHIKLIAIAISSIILLIKSAQLAFWFYEAANSAGLLGTVLKTIGPIIASWMGPISMVLAGLTAVVGAIMAAKKLNGEFDAKNVRMNQEEKQARFTFEKQIDDYIAQKYPVQANLGAVGKSYKLTEQQKAIQNERARALQMKDYLMYQYDEANKKGTRMTFSANMMNPFAMNGVVGMADSSKNVPMPVEAKKGKLDSIGRIEDNVSLDNDGIEMMKMIAERQWVMQNEVTVPQKVEVNIDKSVNMDEDSVASLMTNSMKIAVASSMRGAATA